MSNWASGWFTGDGCTVAQLAQVDHFQKDEQGRGENDACSVMRKLMPMRQTNASPTSEWLGWERGRASRNENTEGIEQVVSRGGPIVAGVCGGKR